MRKFLNKAGKVLRSIKNSFFLKKRTPLPSTIQILKDLYPSVDWSRVDFYEGLPWFTPFIAPYVTAQALPQFYSLSRYRIYLKNFDESKAQSLADIVHEGYHVMQAMRFWKGYGFGFFRGLMFYYNALFLKYGYHSNPFEITAHAQEYRFWDYCFKHELHETIPPVTPAAFSNISKETPLVFNEYQFQYKESRVALACSFVFCTLVTITKPFADVLVLGVGLVIPKERELKTIK